MREPAFDPRCAELARFFLDHADDVKTTRADVPKLAERIQGAIEEYISTLPQLVSEPEPEPYDEDDDPRGVA